ncbi:FGF2 [Branchiostoma lanceolatum]|uniref:Fibroblast growth factor n=1 Tax=Branchiostoma lanceolatum TaxID=7740 RepID=A0A8K0A2D3_BRALA|nr:FGF2 [Branchiostoma lanceolatum]
MSELEVPATIVDEMGNVYDVLLGKDPESNLGFGKYKDMKQLYCRNKGYHVQIMPDGRITGTKENNDPYAMLEIFSPEPGVVTIRGVEADRFLAIDESGRLYSSDVLNDECYFLETLEANRYNTYRSQKYAQQNWYMGITKRGEPKLASRTKRGQKAVQFLPREITS